MARVPTYDGPTVDERPIPGARQESIASPALFGAAGDNIKRRGDAVQTASQGGAIVAAKMQEREDADRFFAADTALKDDLIQFSTAQKDKKGAAALADGGVTQQTDQWFGEAVKRHSEILTNDRQRYLFTQAASKLRLSTMETMSQHQATQARVSVVDSSNAAITGSVNLAAANANDWTVSEAQAKNIRAAVSAVGRINGWDKSVVDATVGEKLTLMHQQVIQELVRTNPAAAKAYYQKYENEIDGAKRAEIGKFADEAASTSVGDGAADTIWKANGPKSSSDPVNIADMEERLRTTLKGNDAAIEKGIKGLRERAQSYQAQRKSQSDALEASVNGLILGGKFSRSAPEFLQLSAKDPEAARKVLSFVENQAYTAEARGAAREQRLDAAENRAQRRLHNESLDMALRVSDPEVLASMTRDEVVNLLPTLGRESTAALVAKYDTMQRHPEKLIEAKIDKQDFDRIALAAGFRPNEAKKPEEEKDRLVRLQSQVETVIDTEQRAKKRQLTRDEKTTIMQREIDNAVLVGRFFPDKRPAAALSPNEQEKAYVLVGPTQQKVTVSEIPPAFRINATTSRRAQGLATTEAQLAELWLRSQGKYKDK